MALRAADKFGAEELQMHMQRTALIILLSLTLPSLPVSAEGNHSHLFVCRSPLLAFDFWNALQDIRGKGVKLTPEIAEEVCNGMRAGQEPQCIRVESASFNPVATGWGGAMAMSDGKTKVWFHNPDAGGWVHPEYYVSYVNGKTR